MYQASWEMSFEISSKAQKLHKVYQAEKWVSKSQQKNYIYKASWEMSFEISCNSQKYKSKFQNQVEQKKYMNQLG